MTRTLWIVPLALALAATAGAAQTTQDAAGSAVGDDRSEVFPIAEDHVVVLLMTDYADVSLDEPEGALDGASGPCFGKIEIRAGTAGGDGYCLWRDRDGELAISRWTVTGMTEAGGPTGTWESIGGSGKWVGARGGGGYEVAVDEATARRELSITGEITMP